MRDKDTPLRLVRKWAKMAPGCYEALDRCRQANGNGIMWPDWCELPIAAAYTYLVSQHGCDYMEAAELAAELTACWTWRQSKILYAFDADLAAALAAQADDFEDTDVLPDDLILHLPYQCIYIKAPGLAEYVDGFFAWLESDQRWPDRPELRVQWVLDSMEHSVSQVLHLVPGGTIADCIADTNDVIRQNLQGPQEMARGADDIRMILTAIQLILYLVSDQADIQDQPAPVTFVREHGQARIIRDKASEIAAKDVGVRIGAALRRGMSRHSAPHGDSAGTGTAKRPHARRGHWHHYWAGPRDDRKLILKWTAPTFVHPEVGREENVVAIKVK